MALPHRLFLDWLQSRPTQETSKWLDSLVEYHEAHLQDAEYLNNPICKYMTLWLSYPRTKEEQLTMRNLKLEIMAILDRSESGMI